MYVHSFVYEVEAEDFFKDIVYVRMIKDLYL